MKIIKRIKNWIFFNFDLPLTDDYFEVKCSIYFPKQGLSEYQTVTVPKTLIDIESYYMTQCNIKEYVNKRVNSGCVILEDFFRNPVIGDLFKVQVKDNNYEVVPRYTK